MVKTKKARAEMGLDLIDSSSLPRRPLDDSSSSATKPDESTENGTVSAPEDAKATTDKDYPSGEFQFQEASLWKSSECSLLILGSRSRREACHDHDIVRPDN